MGKELDELLSGDVFWWLWLFLVFGGLGGGDFLILLLIFWKCFKGRVLLFRIVRGWDKDVIFDRLLIVGFFCLKVKLLLERLLFGFIWMFRIFEVSGGRDVLFVGIILILVFIVKLVLDGCIIVVWREGYLLLE